MRTAAVASFLLLSLAFAAPTAFASGSGGGGGSGYGSVSGAYSSASYDPNTEAYSRGKSLIAKRIACKQCAFPDGVKDVSTAQKVAARVRAGEFELKPGERDQVLYYLSRRFDS